MVEVLGLVTAMRSLEVANLLIFVRHLALLGASSLAVAFALFQQRCLPARAARCVARWAFWPTLPLTYLRLTCLPPRAGIWTRVDDTVFVGAAPTAILGHPSRLRRLGVAGVVNLCEEYSGPEPSYARLGMDQLRLPTLDHVEPSPEALREAVDFIDRFHDRGDKVYVHCKAGHGRSAAVALAWLLHTNRRTAPFALYQQLAAKRKVRADLWRQPNVLKFHERSKDS